MGRLIEKARSRVGALKGFLRARKEKKAGRRDRYIQNCKSAVLSSANPAEELESVSWQLRMRGYDANAFARSLLEEIDVEISGLSGQGSRHPARASGGQPEIWERDLARLMQLRMALQEKLQANLRRKR